MARVRIGIVGCGEVAQIIHLPSLYQLADLYEVTALCDVSAKVLDGIGSHWGVAKRFFDYHELVQQPDVDAVLVANPHVYHTDVTLAAIAAGKHVLVEKPMSISLEEADRIVEAQRATGVVVQVGYMRRHAPAFQEAKRRLPELGPIGLARVRDVIGANALIINQTSRVIRGDDIPDQAKAEMTELQNQRVAEALGSVAPGVRRAYMLMLGLSSHDLSAMRELLGMPQRVLSTTWREPSGLDDEAARPGPRFMTATFDYGSFVCQFETGVDSIPRFDACIEIFSDDRVLKVQYDTPYVRNLPITLHLTAANGKGGVTEETIHPAWGDAFVAEWQKFHEAIQNRAQPPMGPADFCQDLQLFQEMARLIQAG